MFKVVNVRGGIGNQLLISTMARLQSANSTIVLDYSWFNGGAKSTETKRQLYVKNREFREICSTRIATVIRLLSKLGILEYTWDYGFQYMSQKHWGPTLDKVIDETFNQRDPLISDAVYVHVRLGDYLLDENKGKYMICDESYYLHAIEKIRDYTAGPIYIVTDSPDLMPHLFPKLTAAAKIIDLSELDTFRILCRARYLIGSNSTFSLLAGMYRGNEKKVAVFPSKWREYEVIHIPESLEGYIIWK